jgi:hypothetical protein
MKGRNVEREREKEINCREVNFLSYVLPFYLSLFPFDYMKKHV